MIARKTTKALLGESLRELSATRTVDRITVREIVKNCGLSPATFYRHFHDKYDLIAWIYNCQMEDILVDVCEGARTWRAALKDMIAILEGDRDYYKNAFVNTEGQNSFFHSTHARCVELLTAYVRAAMPEEDPEALFDVRFYLKGASYTVLDWCVNSLPYSAGALAEYIYRAMPERLRPYFRE